MTPLRGVHRFGNWSESKSPMLLHWASHDLKRTVSGVGHDLDAFSLYSIRYYGSTRLSMRGKGIVSRRWLMPHSHVTVRSTPSPKPACGTLP